jgi:hypothetical protein
MNCSAAARERHTFNSKLQLMEPAGSSTGPRKRNSGILFVARARHFSLIRTTRMRANSHSCSTRAFSTSQQLLLFPAHRGRRTARPVARGARLARLATGGSAPSHRLPPARHCVRRLDQRGLTASRPPRPHAPIPSRRLSVLFAARHGEKFRQQRTTPAPDGIVSP